MKEIFKKYFFLFSIIFIVLVFSGTFPQKALAVSALPDGQEGAGGPQDGQVGVPIDALVDRAFTGALDESTVNTTNVLLQANEDNVQGGTPTGPNLCVNVYLQNTDRIICDHLADDTPLDPDTWYTFKITTGVKDSGGNPIEAEFTSQFQTGSFGGGDAFKPPPFVLSTIPFPGGTLPANGKILISFSLPMRTSGEGSLLNVNNIQLFAISNGVPVGSNLFTDTSGWSFDILTYKLKIAPPTLTVGNWYRVIIKGFPNFNPETFDPQNPPCGGEGESACVLSADGLPIPGPDFWLDFQVESEDTTPPSVLGSFPENDATGIDRAVFDIAVSFNEGLDASTVKSGSVTPPQDGTVLLFKDSDGDNSLDLVNYDLTTDPSEDIVISTGSVVLDPDGVSIHYSPNTLLDADTKYFLVLRGGSSGIKDYVGNALSNDIVISFTTGNLINGEATDNTPPTILFANADNFGIFITFSEPMKFDPIANVSKSSSNGVNDVNNLSNWKLETSPDGTNWLGVNLLGREVKYESYTNTLIIENLLLPPGDQFKIRVASGVQIHDLSSNSLPADSFAQGPIKIAAETGGQLGPGGLAGGPDFFEMGLNPIGVMPKSALAGATTRYRVEFTLEESIPTGGKITLTFPSGFSFTPTCSTLPTDTFENSDLNGPSPGIVTVTASCDGVSRVISLTVSISGGDLISAGERLRFELQGITNSTVPKDFTTDGYTVDIKTYDDSGALRESKTSMPFFITTPGNNTIQGKVFLDSNSNGILDGGESGVNGNNYPIKVCLGGPTGYECQAIDSNGDYSFTQLPDSFYHLDIPPISTGNYTGGPFFRDINVSGGQAVTENFGVREVLANHIIDVLITGGPANTKVDVFAFQGGMPAPGQPPSMGFVVREVTLDATGGGSAQLPAGPGKWQVGVGPWMPKDPGTPPSPPDFTFMPPKPIEVKIDGGVQDLCPNNDSYEVCFSLQVTNRRIIGKVVDGSGRAISHAFVMARPFTIDPTEPSSAGMAEADSNGVFEIKVVDGTYIVEASIPGMPLSNSFECTVKNNSDNTDNNIYADVYCEGALIKNDVAGFNSSTLTGLPDDNDLIIKIKKGDTSISGRVLDEEGNPIPFAHVSAMEVASCVAGQDIPIGPFTDAPTDSSGTYTLYVSGGSSSEPKYWKLQAFAPGFGDLPQICTSVVQGQDLTGKNFQVSSVDFGTVTGQVLQGGSGVSGAFVNIYGQNGANSTVTDSDGNYTLKIKAGSGYTIEGFVPGQGPTSVITDVTVTAGATLSGQNLMMQQPGTLIVYVCEIDTDSPGATSTCIDKVVGNAFIDARDSQGRGNSTSSNPIMGVYELYLPAGTYTVKASEPAVGFLGKIENVDLTAGQTTYINIEPPSLYTVTGSVTSPESACITGATVVLSNTSTGQLIMAEVLANGSFSISNVPQGTYNVFAMKPGCIDSQDPGFLHVTGTEGDTYEADTRTLLRATATISGRVTLNGENIAFPSVVVASSSIGKKVVTEVDTSQSGTTNSNYTLALTEGTWVLKARSDGYQSDTVEISISSGSSHTQNLPLSPISGYTRKEAKPFTVKPARGGIVKNPEIDPEFELNIPPGALGTSSNDISILTKETTAVADTTSQNVIGDKGVAVTPKDASGNPITTLSSSASLTPTITIPYDESDVISAGTTEDKLIIGVWSGEKWEPLPTNCNPTTNECTAKITHFSTFALLDAIGGGAPSTPTGLAAIAVSSSQIDLSWNAVSGATSYDIYRDTSPTGSFPRIGSEPTVSGGNNTSYSDTGLTAGTTYYYKISALNASGESAASSAISVTTLSAGGGAVPVSFLQPSPVKEEVPEEVPEQVIEQVPEEVPLKEKTLEERLAEVQIPTLEKPITEMTVDELEAKIAQFQEAISKLQAILSEIIIEIPGIPSGFTFERNLRPGEISDDVKCLQIVLNSDPDTQLAESGVGSPGNETNYFGPLTKAAVIKFQEKYSDDVLAPWGLTSGTGFVGSTTRAKLNEILGH